MRVTAWILGLTGLALCGWDTYVTWRAGAVSFASASATVFALFVLLTTESIHWWKKKDSPTVAAQHDIDLFKAFQAALPFNPTVRTLRDHDFLIDYRADALVPLNRFIEKWDDPNFEFVDSELETAKLALLKAAEVAAMQIAAETVQNDRIEGLRTVYPYDQRGRGMPDHVRESAQRANQAARAVGPLYDEFVRLAKRKLT